nr:RNA-directed DNA polymerase, eukaryota [Tanacetum cinerariifolium]
MLDEQEGACIPLTTKQHDFLSYESDEEREEGELTANYLFMTKLQLASSNTDSAPVYDTDGISKVPNFDHYYGNEMYNLLIHEEQQPELLGSTQGEKPIKPVRETELFESFEEEWTIEMVGGAEINLNRVGIRLKVVVLIEPSEPRRKILRQWWENSHHTGELVQIATIQKLSSSKLGSLMDEFGVFDFIIYHNQVSFLAIVFAVGGGWGFDGWEDINKCRSKWMDLGIRKNKQDTSHPIRNPFQKEVKKIATSFFVTNFPDYIDAKGLWKVCESYGRIVDAFIANKRSKAEKRLGFVRYLGVKNEEEFAKSLANIWIRNFHMYASVARFQRQEKAEFNPKERLKKVTGHTSAKLDGKHGSVNSQFKTSYASVLNGGG